MIFLSNLGLLHNLVVIVALNSAHVLCLLTTKLHRLLKFISSKKGVISKHTINSDSLLTSNIGMKSHLLSPFYYKTGTMGQIGSTSYVLPIRLSYHTLYVK